MRSLQELGCTPVIVLLSSLPGVGGAAGGGDELHSLLGKDCFHVDAAAGAAPRHSVLRVDGGALPACERQLGSTLLPGLPCREPPASMGPWWRRAAPRPVLGFCRGATKPARPHHGKSDSSSGLRGGKRCWSAVYSCLLKLAAGSRCEGLPC